MQKISELTPEQESLLVIYREKWQQAALSSVAIDREKATRTIEKVYAKISKHDDFDIYFFDSPYQVANLSFLEELYPQSNWDNPRKLNNLLRKIENDLSQNSFFVRGIFRDIEIPLIEAVGVQLNVELWNWIGSQLHFHSPIGSILYGLQDAEQSLPFWKSLPDNHQSRLKGFWGYLANALEKPDTICSTCSQLDYCINVLGCNVPDDLWQLLQDFVADCGWTFFLRDFCFTCNRPSKILLDDFGKVHSENDSAIKFTDGFQIYVHHGNFVSSSKSKFC